MRRLIEALTDCRVIATGGATFATIVSVLQAGGTGEFYMHYFAGAATAIAMLMWIEDED